MAKKFLISFLCFLTVITTRAQETMTMYVPEGATVSFGNNTPAGIFGYLSNNGNISIKENGQVYFLGKIWINNEKGKLSDGEAVQNSRKGGTVTFFQPNPVFGNLGQQILEAAYKDSTTKGPSFANLTVDNNAGLILTSDASAINTTLFKRGHVYLNNFNFILGDSSSTGNVLGYDESRYFVTGTQTLGGYLKYRLLPAGAMTPFPIGPTDKIYSPLQVLNRGTDDAFYARAFDRVLTHAYTGQPVTDSTLQLTWSVGKASSAAGEALVTLQHDMAQEDPVFRSNRDKSFVSLFGDGRWDKPYNLSNPQTPGNISSSFSIPSAMMNARKLTLSGNPVFLTKRVTKGQKSLVIPNVFSPNGDNINDKWNIRGLVEYENCIVEIFNRYGQLIYHSVGYNQPWDGTYKGNAMPVATYYYLINLKPGEAPLSGSVTLLR